jgi:hypothetical protein
MGARTAEVTPDGHALVFMSSRSLTGYDNVLTNKPGQPQEVSEVYVYQAESKQLFCTSCSRTGEAPRDNYNLVEGESAGFLPVSWSNTYIPKWISDDGSRVFFDSAEPLVANDTNESQDVYEWERDGADDCQESRGCVYLISGGTDTGMGGFGSGMASWLVGSTPTGNDVFFVTREKLTPENGTEADVMYDARVGGFVPPLPPACTGTGCQGLPPGPPVFATPASVTFNGVGNFPPAAPSSSVSKGTKPLTKAQKLAKALTACRGKHQKKKRLACEAAARKLYGKKSNASKASKGKK